MKVYKFFLIAILLFGCTLRKKTPGIYRGLQARREIQLNSDYTFIYSSGTAEVYFHSRGTWKMAGKNKIVLNSNLQSSTIPLNVTETPANNNVIAIDLKNKDGEPLTDYRCQVFINKKLYLNIRCDSIAYIPINIPIDSISFGFSRPGEYEPFHWNIQTDTYVPKIQNGVKLTFNILYNREYRNYQVITRDTLIASKNKLKYYNKRYKQWEIYAKASWDELYKAAKKQREKKH